MVITELYQLLFGKNHLRDGDVIEMSEHARLGGISSGEPYKNVYDLSQSVAEKVTKVDKVVYYAMALPGSSYSDAVWQVKRVDATDPNNAYTTWADGNINFDNVATDLSALNFRRYKYYKYSRWSCPKRCL
jgi:hypothetical protein